MATATRVCTKNAATTPIQTSSGRNRVDITRVAMKVLSGSSTTKMVANTMAMVVKSMPMMRTKGTSGRAAAVDVPAGRDGTAYADRHVRDPTESRR